MLVRYDPSSTKKKARLKWTGRSNRRKGPCPCPSGLVGSGDQRRVSSGIRGTKPHMMITFHMEQSEIPYCCCQWVSQQSTTCCKPEPRRKECQNHGSRQPLQWAFVYLLLRPSVRPFVLAFWDLERQGHLIGKKRLLSCIRRGRRSAETTVVQQNVFYLVASQAGRRAATGPRESGAMRHGRGNRQVENMRAVRRGRAISHHRDRQVNDFHRATVKWAAL
jgi:hypothetical protein